ncbi:MAG: Arm DNA-binding domain-containing protein [Clostridium sp.]
MPCKRMSEDRSSPNYKKWYCYFYYITPENKKIKKKKEGFLTKKEAIEYENEFIINYKGETGIIFEQLCTLYMKHAKLNVRKTNLNKVSPMTNVH